MYRLTILALLATTTAAAQQPVARAPLTEPQLVTALAAHLDSLAAAGRFSGVVVLAKGDRRVFERAYGLADREARRANGLDTRFNLGSINKAFTATAIRQLAAAGKLSLDDRLIRHLPDYANRDVAERVTIGQLLEHSSGIGGNIFAAPPGGSRGDLRAIGDFLRLFAQEPLQFEPGTRRQYSNAGYIVLGAVIERLSGMTYYDYVRANVFQPAGMTETDSYARDSLPPNTATGYVDGVSNLETLPGRGSSAGGGYSTAADLLRFARAVREGRIAGAPPGGMGIAGGAPGINAILETGIAGGYDVVVLANLGPPAAEDVARQVRQWLGVSDEDGPRIIRRRAGEPERR
jgi:CubicO group peptidase (beta-lactamase class C family)